MVTGQAGAQGTWVLEDSDDPDVSGRVGAKAQGQPRPGFV